VGRKPPGLPRDLDRPAPPPVSSATMPHPVLNASATWRLARTGSRPLALPLRGLCPAVERSASTPPQLWLPCHRRGRPDATGASKTTSPTCPNSNSMAPREPSGCSLAGDVNHGMAADDPLTCVVWRVASMLGRTAALRRRLQDGAPGNPAEWPPAAISLTRLPQTGEVAAQFAAWWKRPSPAQRRQADRDPGEDDSSARDTSSSGRRPPWWARPSTPGVSGCRSSSQRPPEAKPRPGPRLEKAEAAPRLDAPPGPGRTPFTTGWQLIRPSPRPDRA